MTATVLGARGLFTSPNQVAGSPQGSAVVADNVVVSRPGIYETRRGYAALADVFPTSDMETVVEFKGSIIGWGGNLLARYDEGAGLWRPYGYVAPTFGAVSHTVNMGYTDVLPVVSNLGAVTLGNGTVTVVTQNVDGVNSFTWSSTAGVGDATPQAFEPTNTSELVTSTGARTGVFLTWGDESYGPGDTYTFAVTGGSLPTAYLPPDGPLKDSAGNLLPGKVRFHETGGCLYFTTSKGVFRLEDPLGVPYLSGISQGLIGTAALTGTSGFLADGFSVAYRETWSKRTPEGRIIEGAPSGRVTIFNTVGGGATRNVTRTIPIPPDLPPDAFLRVWRTESFPNVVGPGEDYAQVHEKALADMPAGATSYTFTDITPDAIRGDAAYFSATLGDGLVASKFRPPLATQVLTFRDSTVYIGSQGLEAVQLTLLGVSAFTSSNVGLSFRFEGGSTEVYRSTTSTTPADGFFTVYTDGTPSQNVERTVKSLVMAINLKSGGRLRGIYISDDNGSPGSIHVEARDLDAPQFVVQALGTTEQWAPALRTGTNGTIGARDGLGNVSANTITPHGLVVDQVINVTATPASFYGSGPKTVTAVTSSTSFDYYDPGPEIVLSGTINYTTTSSDLSSERSGNPSSIAWTPLGEPDAVPVLQFAQVGKFENPVLSSIVLGNALYLLKADGLYRLSGDVPTVFALDQVDTTVEFIAPYAPFTLGGNAYALTTEGLKMWTETGKPQPMDIGVSRDILDIIVKNRSAVDQYAFSVNYESDRTMLLWLPNTPTSERADFAYRYNYLTETWTTESTDALCAIVSPTKDRLVIGTPGLGGRVLLERKSRTSTDYQGPDGEAVVATVTYSPQMGSDPALGKNFNRMKYFMDPNTPTPTTLGVAFHTDWVPAPVGFSIPVAHARGNTFETLVDANHKRGTRLYVTVSHSVAGEKLALSGYSVTFYEHQLGTV